MKIFFKRGFSVIDGFLSKMRDDHINAYAAQSSFFIIISVFPFIMLLFNLIKYTPISENLLLNKSVSVLPKAIAPLAQTIINEMYENSSGTIISITAFLALWSASKGVLAIVGGLNNIFSTKITKNYFISRLISAFYTIIFIVAIIGSLLILVYGNSFIRFFRKHNPFVYDILQWIFSLRLLYVTTILTLLFIGLYKLGQSNKYSALSHLPGALFSAMGWFLFSYFYSIYIDNFAGNSYTYGSLTTFVLMMLWVYFCVYILFIGAEINIYFRKNILYAKEFIKFKKNRGN